MSIKEFSVSIYGEPTAYNNVLSKARCRIFYKYGNRNGTYITDEFAEKLISSLPYTPVKGIYSDNDYEDHGDDRSDGRIYGIVPENPNVQWESHLDEDGVERTYACADVLIFTALYEEAADIVGKSQSMELFGPAIKYHTDVINGDRYIVFDEGCFLGLQILGNEVEPCFEGASFYTLRNKIEDIVCQLRALDKGGNEMPEDKILEEEKPEVEIPAEEEKPAEEVPAEEEKPEEEVPAEEEKPAEEEAPALHSLELDDATYARLAEAKGEMSEVEFLNQLLDNADAASTKIVELEKENSTLSLENSTLNATLTEKNSLCSTLNEEVESLRVFKQETERAQKTDIIAEYEGLLEESVLETYRVKMDEYTARNLDMELAYALRKANPSALSKKPEDGMVPKEVPESGLAHILSKYHK